MISRPSPPVAGASFRRRLAAATHEDDGLASVQSVVVYPVVLLLVATIVQGVLFFHAQNVARDAANGAVQVARTERGTREAGLDEASARLLHAGDRVIADAHVAVERGPRTVIATVTGNAPSIVPGLRGLRVEQAAVGPVERFTVVGAP